VSILHSLYLETEGLLGHHPCLGVHNISSNIVVVDDSVEPGVGILWLGDGSVESVCMDGHIAVVDLSTETSLKIFITSTSYATMATTSTARPASYILMEYCGGRDLSTVIKHARKHNRPIPEDTIWNYFMQTLLALHHCHHPNGSARSGSGSSDNEGKEKRAQVLHRDLKPDNGERRPLFVCEF
jgi:serine/threonine protein kinase